MNWAGVPVYYHCIKSCKVGKEKVYVIKHKERSSTFHQGGSEFPNTWCLLKPGSFMKDEVLSYDAKFIKTSDMECLVTDDKYSVDKRKEKVPVQLSIFHLN